jgi:hypothetical protein
MPDDAALVTAFLADRHVACPGCGYDLHGAAGGVCPECGVACRIGIVPRHEDARTHRVLRMAALALVAGNLVWAVYYPVNVVAYGITFIMGLHSIAYIVTAALGLGVGIAALRTFVVCRLLALWLIVVAVSGAIGLFAGFPRWIFSGR